MPWKRSIPDTHAELVLFSRVPLEREQVNQVIRDAGLSPLHNIRQIRMVDEIPVLGTGKTNYRAFAGDVGGVGYYLRSMKTLAEW